MILADPINVNNFIYIFTTNGNSISRCDLTMLTFTSLCRYDGRKRRCIGNGTVMVRQQADGQGSPTHYFWPKSCTGLSNTEVNAR